MNKPASVMGWIERQNEKALKKNFKKRKAHPPRNHANSVFVKLNSSIKDCQMLLRNISVFINYLF